MKKRMIVLAALPLALTFLLTACNSGQTTTETTIETDTMIYPDGSTQTTTEVETTTQNEDPTLGQRVDTAISDTKNAARKAKEDVKDAAHSVKEDAKEFARDVKDETKKGARKVEEKAKEVKEDLKKDKE